jgi:hypothetical protein
MTQPAVPTHDLPSDLQLAFQPLHKRNFGLACGAAAALLIACATAVHLVRSPHDGMPLTLLGSYFAGYRVSPAGIVIGAFWAGLGGFFAGWFLAFCRNFALAVIVFLVRTRAQLFETRDFLDHI